MIDCLFGLTGEFHLFPSFQKLGMSTVLSTLQAGSLRELLSALGSLATWKTLALILAVINLKNLPFIWHVSADAGYSYTCPL
jgi:hypothetical protein